MENFYPYIYDLTIILIVVLSVMAGVKKGMLSMLISVIGKIAAFALALVLSGVIAEFAYGTFVEPKMTETINKRVETALSDNIEYTSEELIAKATENMPQFIRANAQKLADKLTVNSEESKSITGDITENIISPVIVPVIEIAVFIILLTILLIMVKFFSKVFIKVNKVPLVGGLNKLLGGAVGLINAALIIFAMLYIIRGAVLVSGGKSKLFCDETIKQSKMFTELYKQELPLLKEGE